MYEALSTDLGRETVMLWHKDEDLSAFSTDDCIVLPGGFSYGDYLRCGAIARFSPMMKSVIEFAEQGGKVLGVCNGFQILCEAGLLPGALLRNSNQKFICKNVFLKGSKNQIFTLPIAHGEGRYYADEVTLKQIENNSQVIYKYVSADGFETEGANPNGAINNIAGICNQQRNVFGMMPHPERACSALLGNTDGVQVFKELGLIN
jgi:phosphoribosylformylglycinamidine synthase